jgi:hypothetical protein
MGYVRCWGVTCTIDACSNPPYFRGVNTSITDLLNSAEPKIPKQKWDQTKDHGSKAKGNKVPFKSNDEDKRDQGKTNSHLARRPDHEQPAKLPEGLKRPDLEAMVDGNKIASDAQRQLYGDVKRGNCTRCHKGGHIRKDCKEPKFKWEDKFDKEKDHYWVGVLKWQQKGTGPKASPATQPLTLHVKPEKSFNTIATDSDSDDDSTPLYHYRMTMQDPDDEEDMDDDNEILILTVTDEVEAVAPSLTVAAILADVNRQLVHYPVRMMS